MSLYEILSFSCRRAFLRSGLAVVASVGATRRRRLTGEDGGASSEGERRRVDRRTGAARFARTLFSTSESAMSSSLLGSRYETAALLRLRVTAMLAAHADDVSILGTTWNSATDRGVVCEN